MAKVSNLPTVDTWLETDNLILLEGWARDGYTVADIAFKIGITNAALQKWMRDQEEIRKAINDGRELVDYKVENALLKAALGYKTKEVKVTTTIHNGVAVEQVKEVTTAEAAPNVQACKVWLYNRQPKKWKPESVRGQSLLDAMDEDNDIKITIERAGSREQELAESGSGQSVRTGVESEIDEDWQDEVNQSVSIRKATQDEKREAQKKAKMANKKADTEIQLDDEDKIERVPTPQKHKHSKSTHDSATVDSGVSNDPDSIDYWPDDWTDEDE